MAAKEIHMFDVGTIFEITLKDGDDIVNLEDATTKEIYFELPDGTTLTKTAVFKTNGTDGIIQYLTIITDLSVKGKWKVQAHVILEAPSPVGEWRSDIAFFTVYANLA